MRQQNHDDNPSHCLFTVWCRAEFKANLILHEVKDDMTDPCYIEAEKQSQKALWNFLCNPTSSLYGILLKLKVACHFDDYAKEALDPTCNLIPPRAIMSALYDLENVVIACFGADGVKKQDEELDALARCGVRNAEE